MAEVITRGPIFDGRAEEALRLYGDDLAKTLADDARDRLRSRARRMNKSGRATGAAARSINTRARGTEARAVGESTRGRVWWPWLEGTSRRNLTTRFAGYHAFRIVRGEIDREATAKGDEVLAKYLPMMGGR